MYSFIISAQQIFILYLLISYFLEPGSSNQHSRVQPKNNKTKNKNPNYLPSPQLPPAITLMHTLSLSYKNTNEKETKTTNLCKTDSLFTFPSLPKCN